LADSARKFRIAELCINYHHVPETEPIMPQKDLFEGFPAMVQMKHSKAEALMLQRDGIAGTLRLNFEAWRALLRSNCGGEVQVTTPKLFAGWMRPLNAFGLAAAAVKIQWDCTQGGLGRHVHRLERTYRDVRLDGSDHYLILFQVAGQSAMTQIDRAAQLTVGDVALIDAARPVTFLSQGSTQWLSLRLPRKSVRSHLGFEPQACLRSHGTRTTRLLFDFIRDAETESAFSLGESYMQMAVYDLVGALFAPSDPRPISRSTDKLFARICSLIRDGCSDPDFGPGETAAAAGISLRYVQKLFTGRGITCSEFIYSVRLDHAARQLQRRALLGSGQPLGEIAYGCGFRDYAHFARKFRRRFGYPPGAHAGHGQSAGTGIVRAGTGESASSAHDVQFRAS
jgi:AraC family transcriptional regulator, positive regulator of tynA and feaB